MFKNIFCFLSLLLIPSVLLAQTYQTDSGNAAFTGHTPLFSFEVSSDSLRGTVNLSDSTVAFRPPVNTLDTGNGKRNRDMWQLLEADEHPNATFEGRISTPVDLDSSKQQEVTVNGEFTVHDTSRTLDIQGMMQVNGDQLNISVSWPAKLTDFDMEPPSVLFYSMKDQIEIRIEASLTEATK